MREIETYSSWKRQSVKLDELYLDPENIRLEIEDRNQDAIIADLFINEKAYDILKSITDYGWLPDETPVVIKDDSKLCVIEGNRRIAALKAIVNLKILPPEFHNRAKKLIGDFQPITEIEVLLAPDRPSTDKYLASKHTVNTRRQWSALRRAYFYYAQKEKGDTIVELIEKYPSTNIPKYIKMYEMHRAAMSVTSLPQKTMKKLENKRDFDMSTLERLYDYKFAQQHLGLSFNAQTGEVQIPTSKEFKAVYTKIIEDILSKYITSRKRIDTEEHARAYLKEITPKQLTTKTMIDASKLTPRIAAKVKKKPLFPKSLICTIDNAPGIERRLDELQRIDYYDLKYASLDSLRSFLETTIKKYLHRTGQQPKKTGKYTYLEDSLKKMKDLVNNENNQELVQVIEFLLKDKIFMEAVNHNPSFIANEEKTKDLADGMIELLVYIFDKFKNDPNKNT